MWPAVAREYVQSIFVLAPFFAGNRRDGARLLSSALVFLTIGITQLDQRWGQVLTLIASVVCLYWGVAYRRLDR